jgi:4-alpha-glucanotransferase
MMHPDTISTSPQSSVDGSLTPPSSRSAGLLLHITSLPGPFGIGDLGPEAERFLEWAAAAGQGIWQILPYHPTAGNDSPYGGISAFAGNPLLISPRRLAQDGLLTAGALADPPRFSSDRADFSGARRWKEAILRESWSLYQRRGSPARDELAEFRAAVRQEPWLEDWALFAALKGRLGHRPWPLWPDGLATRNRQALAAARRDLGEEILFHVYVQLLFSRQWKGLRASAREKGIAIFGDVPIYVTHDSADVWAHQDLFVLDPLGWPESVAGVPPDYFSETGQLWGYPLYRWDELERRGFRWWIDRVATCLSTVDLIRIDHFRGLAGYWAVPAGDPDARRGRWLPGPGEKLFRALSEKIGPMKIVAEDLGLITPDVTELLAKLAIPGMKVLQFAFSEDDSPHAPHRHVENAVVYPGTHDNDTARGWFAGLSAEERRRVADYLGDDGSGIEWALIRAAYASVAARAVVAVQDVFGLGSEARMNVPALAEGNWTWRARGEDFTAERAARLQRLARLAGRFRARRGGDPETGEQP